MTKHKPVLTNKPQLEKRKQIHTLARRFTPSLDNLYTFARSWFMADVGQESLDDFQPASLRTPDKEPINCEHSSSLQFQPHEIGPLKVQLECEDSIELLGKKRRGKKYKISNLKQELLRDFAERRMVRNEVAFLKRDIARVQLLKRLHDLKVGNQ